MADPIDTDTCPGAAHHGSPFRYCPVEGCGWMEEPELEHPAVAAYDELKPDASAALANSEAEVDRLRAENAALAAALEDIADMRQSNLSPQVWVADADCSGFLYQCHVQQDDDPGEWCPVCVAEICWCAWKMGVLGA